MIIGKKNNHTSSLKKNVEYVQLHKCQTGKSIVLKDSEKKTRIVSHVTSKGDGRKVVVCLNITERTLKLVSGNKSELRYMSHLHVPMTRGINKVYFQLTQNGDDIHNRFRDIENVYFTPDIKNNFCIKKLEDYVDNTKIREILKTNHIEYNDNKKNKDFYKKKRIDFTDHCSRYVITKNLITFSFK